VGSNPTPSAKKVFHVAILFSTLVRLLLCSAPIWQRRKPNGLRNQRRITNFISGSGRCHPSPMAVRSLSPCRFRCTIGNGSTSPTRRPLMAKPSAKSSTMPSIMVARDWPNGATADLKCNELARALTVTGLPDFAR